MRMNYSDIRQELLDQWGDIAESRYPEDRVSELVESALPIYYGDIIRDWQEMPSEYSDVWQQEGYEGKQITDFMTYDLWRYYGDQYHTIYNQLLEEKETANA